MNKNIFIIIFLFIIGNVNSQITAFPKAEGGGAFATGGRGGKVLYVTSLEDDVSVEGTLRWAINQKGARYILFQVAGIIDLKSELKINKGDVTIAGQTAPGDGICIKGYPFVISADNVIVRFLRFRMGDENGVQDDALKGNKTKNVIVDHCSVSWSTDECASFYDNENFTLQWCVISESLRNSIHKKGNHGFGGIWGGKNASFHHNLLAHHDSRNPRFNGLRRAGLKYNSDVDEERVDFRNNVIYNWGSNSSYGGESGKYNLVGNYFKSGPATKKNTKKRITSIDIDANPALCPPGYGLYFLKGNYVFGFKEVNKDNWKGVNLPDSISENNCKVKKPFPSGPVKTQSAQVAYRKVLAYAGASLNRDSIDKRIMNEVNSGTFTFTGSNGSINGIIDTQKDVGGWPVYTFNSLLVKPDSDADGMPDDWELKHKLNKNDASDAFKFNPNKKYCNLEIYLNSLVEELY
ncbi:MAG TPA: pectate lyase [Paludibacter sp.]|nr:pectate lyase [Paludibacter sp.]